MDISRERIGYKRQIFNEARAGGTALRRVKEDHKKLQTWVPGEGEFERTYLEKNLGGRDIEALCDYFNNYHVGALEHIVKDRFEIGYHIYGDITREAMLGENTNALSAPVHWEKLDVEVVPYRGEGHTLEQDPLAMKVVKEGVRNRQDVTKFTGWNPDQVRLMSDVRLSELTELIKATGVNQNKFTRLVKGFLIYLSLAESGPVNVIRDLPNVVVSGPNAIMQSFSQPNRAYVHNSNPSSDPHSVTLTLMGEAFPPSFIQSHVTVPADGDHVFLVACGGQVSPAVNIRLTDKLVLASIFRYASDVGVSSDLQGALIAACSLKENRYFSRVGLPAVVDYCDLLMPQFVVHDMQDNQKAFLTGNMATAVGRIHQMLCFATAKDVITAAECSTKQGYDWRGSVISFLSQQESRIARQGTYFTDIKIMDAVPQFKWLSHMDEGDVEDLSSLSIFEAMWLCDRTRKIADNGSIMHLKCGNHDLTDTKDSLNVLRKEIQTASMTLQESKLPTGDFTIESSSVRSVIHRGPRRVNRLVQEVTMTFKCDAKPNTIIPNRKVRRSGSQASSVPPYMSVRSKSSDVSHNLSKAEVVSEVSSSPPKIRSRTPSGDAEEPRPPLKRKVPIAMPARLASEATGKHVQGAGAKAAAYDTYKKLQERIGTKETITKLTQMGLHDGMTDDEIGAKVADEINKGTIINDRVLMELSVRHKLSESDMTTSEQDYIFNVVRAFRIAKKVAGRDAEEIVNGILQEETECNVNRIDSNNPLVRMVVQHVSDNRETTFLGGTELHKMMTEQSRWVGSVLHAPAEGLVHVANSESWKEHCRSYNIPETEKVIGVGSFQGLAILVSRCANLSAEDVYEIYQWAGDTSTSFMPSEITREELAVPPEQPAREYKERATSTTPRKFLPGDGKWIELAIKTERKLFSVEGLKKLQREFLMTNNELRLMKTKYW